MGPTMNQKAGGRGQTKDKRDKLKLLKARAQGQNYTVSNNSNMHAQGDHPLANSRSPSS